MIVVICGEILSISWNIIVTPVSLSDLDMMEEESIQTCGREHHPALAGGSGTTKAFFIDNLLRLVGIRIEEFIITVQTISEAGRSNRQTNRGRHPGQQSRCLLIPRL